MEDSFRPAASRRKAAACLAEKFSLHFLFCARHQFFLLKGKKFFYSASALTRGRRGFASARARRNEGV